MGVKRFWTAARVARAEDGWMVLLDQHPVRTPARRQVAVPLRAMADEIAAEWDAQDGEVDPLSMPMTRAAATCLDRVAPEAAAVAKTIAAYGETDLLCYRADAPAALVARQQAQWDPMLDWAATTLGAQLNSGPGVMHIAQPPSAIEALSREVRKLDPWALTALAELTTLSGSLVLALAVRHGALTDDEAWELSRLDEQWNIEQWGEDHEAAQLTARRAAEFAHAARLLGLLSIAPAST